MGSLRWDVLRDAQADNGVRTDQRIALVGSLSVNPRCRLFARIHLPARGLREGWGAVSRARNSSSIGSSFCLAALAFESGASLCKTMLEGWLWTTQMGELALVVSVTLLCVNVASLDVEI